MSSSETDINEQLKAAERPAIIEGASIVAEGVRTNASSISAKLSNAVYVGEIVDLGNGLGIPVGVYIQKAPFAKSTEYGYPETVIHGRNGPMHFIGTPEFAGKWIVA